MNEWLHLGIIMKDDYCCSNCGDCKVGYIGQANQILIFGTCPNCGKHINHISLINA